MSDDIKNNQDENENNALDNLDDLGDLDLDISLDEPEDVSSDSIDNIDDALESADNNTSDDMEDLSDLADLPDNVDELSGESDDLDVSDLELDSIDDSEIELDVDMESEQSSATSEEETADIQSNIDLSEDLGKGDDQAALSASSSEIDDSIKIDENGEVDLTQDLDEETVDLGKNNISEESTDTAGSSDIDDLDSELNIDDEFDIDEEIKIDDNLDLDGDLELESSETMEDTSETIISGTDETPDDVEDIKESTEIQAVEESSLDDIDVPELDDSLNDLDGTDLDESFDALDLKSDLGLDDELTLSEEESAETRSEDFELDLVDDAGEPIGQSDEEFGVDLKSGPETIESFELKESSQEESPATDESGVEDTFENIDEIDISSDIDESDFPKDELLDEISLDDTEVSVSDELSLETLEDEALEKSEDIEASADLDEDLDLEIETPVDADETLDVGEELTEEMPSESEEISDELEVDLTDDEINDAEDTINLEDAIQIDEELNLDDIDTTPSELESEIIGGAKETAGSVEDETISIEESELSDIEDKIFPDEESMPEVDEDVSNIDLSGSDSDDLTNSISPLTDSETVFSEDLDEEIPEDTESEDSGNVEDIDLENIPQASISEKDDEEGTIGLSDDELDNIITDTELVETEGEGVQPEEDEGLPEIDETDIEEESNEDISETIDMDSFDADLAELDNKDLALEEESPDDEQYEGLKKEMQEKTDIEVGTVTTEALKTNVKSILTYLDKLLAALPESKIKEFAESDAFEMYKKLFEDLDINH